MVKKISKPKVVETKKRSKKAIPPPVAPVEAKKPSSKMTRVIQRGPYDSYIRKWSRTSHGIRINDDLTSVFGGIYAFITDMAAMEMTKMLRETKRRKSLSCKDGMYAIVSVLRDKLKLEQQVLERVVASIRCYEASKIH